ncbi:MAG: hypothetical protein M0Z95_05120 [Actinomycetota bacterium]|nr:hypothetical protein [Actinomycetota bacterium]
MILEIEPAIQPITGVVLRAGCASRSFYGWTSLADAVAAAMDGDEDGSAVRHEMLGAEET